MSDKPAAVPGNAGPNDYPRMLYHPDGRTCTVQDPIEHERLGGEWSQTPLPVHLRPRATPSAVHGSFDPLAIMIREILNQVLDERGVGMAPGTEAAPHMPPTGRHRR